MVLQDVGIRAEGGSPCKRCFFQLCKEGACLGRAFCDDIYKQKLLGLSRFCLESVWGCGMGDHHETGYHH